MSYKDHAAIYMSLAMAVNFFGYEFGRSGVLTLFTSPVNGFGSTTAYSIAMSCVSPLSFSLVVWYGKLLDTHGPRQALHYTSLSCALVMLICGILVHILKQQSSEETNILLWGLSLRKMVIWILFVFQHSYVQLLYSQYWSFLGTIMSASEGARYFSWIAGLSSISSTVAAASVSIAVKKLDLIGLLILSSISLFAATILGDLAYKTYEKHTADPAEERIDKRESKAEKTGLGKQGFMTKALALFQRTPILVLLFLEVINFRTMCAILNLCYVKKLGVDLSEDSDRAAWTGKLYSMVNGTSALLQFIALPSLLKNMPSKWLWRLIPLLPVICSMCQGLQRNPSLMMISICLFSTKCIDYSTRCVANEMIYVSLDFDGRYFGKEIIGVFGDRLGASLIAVFLSLLTYVVGETTIGQLSVMVSISSLCWGVCAYRLSNLVPKKNAGERDKKIK